LEYVEVLEFPIIEEEKGTGVTLGWVGMIDQPQTPPPSSQFQEEVVLLWSLQKACLFFLYVYSSLMYCTYYY
jgi:hypothetical protein